MVLMPFIKKGQREAVKRALIGFVILFAVLVFFANFSYSQDFKYTNYKILKYNNYNDKYIPKFMIPKKTIDIRQKIWGTVTAFNKNFDVLSYEDDFSIDLKKYIHNYNNNDFKLEITKDPEHLNCNLDGIILNCVFKEKYTGKDSIFIQLTDTSKTYPFISSLKLEFNLTQNVVLPTFKQEETTITFPEDSCPLIHIGDYVNNPDNLPYTVLTTKQMDNGSCSVSASLTLNCSPKNNFYGTDSVELQIKESGSNMLFNFNITPVNDAPELNTSKLNSGKILVAINDGETTTIDLTQYIIDPDLERNYTYQFVSNPTKANCNIKGNKLSCKGKVEGEEDVQIKLFDDYFTLVLPIHLKVTNINQPPQYLDNFDEKGITVFDTNPNFSIDLSKYIEDPDTPLFTDSPETGGQYLVFGVDKISGGANISCSPYSTGLNCVLSGNSAYADVMFWAYDGKTKVEIPKVFRVAIVKPEDFSVVITGPQKVINAQPFDMQYKIKSNLNFDIYKLPITYSTDFSVDVKFYNDDGTKDGSFYYINLNAGKSLQRKIQVTTPNDSTPKTYDLYPKLDGKFNIYAPVTITSIPYDAQYLKDYLSIVSYTPGHNISGHDERMPGFIFGVPFKIYSTLDVPVTLNMCKGVYNAGNLFQKIGNTYNQVPNNVICEQTKLIPGFLDVILYVQNLVPDTMILDVYLKKKGKLIMEKPLAIVLTQKYTTEYVYSYINSPASGTTLSKNTEYDLSVTFQNGYAYSIVNVDGCVYLRKTMAATDFSYSLDNKVYSIVGDNCTKLDLKYYLPEKPQDSKVTKTFKFKTKNANYQKGGANPPWYKIDAGYLLDENYIHKAFGNYNIN